MPRIVGVDLFCGVGGLTHGLVRGGIQVAAGIDIDPSCKFPFEANNSASFIECDVGKLKADDIAPFYEALTSHCSRGVHHANRSPPTAVAEGIASMNRSGRWCPPSAVWSRRSSLIW